MPSFTNASTTGSLDVQFINKCSLAYKSYIIKHGYLHNEWSDYVALPELTLLGVLGSRFSVPTYLLIRVVLDDKSLQNSLRYASPEANIFNFTIFCLKGKR